MIWKSSGSYSPAEKCAAIIAPKAVSIGIRTEEIPTADSIAVITDTITIPEKDRAACLIKADQSR